MNFHKVFGWMRQHGRTLFSNRKESEPLKPYYYVTFRWFIPVDLTDVARALKLHFKVETIYLPEKGLLALNEFPFGERERVRVQADTLVARLSPFRAILFQRKLEPFTERDMELRKRILNLYPRHRPTIGYRKEPPFLVKRQEIEALDR